jgi:hypothetical protein
MSYNGSGTFQINSTGQPVVSGTVISSTAFNALTADLATGLSTAITKDGQTATTARIPFAAGINSTLVTDSSSTTTGSIITAGGVGIAKALYVGTTANFGGVATYSAQPIFSSLTASSAVATDASKGLVSVTNTGTGNNVLATSPTLVTPALGTPTALVGTNITGTAAAFNINGTVGATTATTGAFTTLSATGVTTVQAGTVALPAITTTGDTNTGIFFPAADTIAFAEGGAEAMRIDSSGNVGIGTSSPSGKLAISDGTVVGEINPFSAASGCYIGTRSNHAVLFQVNASEKARIDTSGNLLVGTTSSGSGNDGRVLAKQTSSGGYAVVADAVSNGGTYYLVAFQINGTTVVGQITSNGTTTTYATSSDYRLKENIAPMTGALNKVALLKPVTYKWKSDGSNSQGFIAHELAEIVPECVVGEKDAMRTEQYEVTPAVKDEEGNIVTEAVMGTRIGPVYQGIDTSFLVATLTAAIQEQQALITALTTRITALEAA